MKPRNLGHIAGAMGHDQASSADMGLVHELIMNHDQIRRTVDNLPNGIRTVTESDDPQMAQAIKAHVTSMTGWLQEGREFNMFSSTLPVLFQNRSRIQTQVKTIGKGFIVTQTSPDATVVAALQGHAKEVTDLVREGMVALMRSAMASRGMSPGEGMGNRPAAASQAPVDIVQ
jgi:hypothetical protein